MHSSHGLKSRTVAEKKILILDLNPKLSVRIPDYYSIQVKIRPESVETDQIPTGISIANDDNSHWRGIFRFA